MDNTLNRDVPNPDAAFPRNALVDETAKLQQTGQHGIGGLGSSDLARDQPISSSSGLSSSTHPASSTFQSSSSPSLASNNTVSTSTTTPTSPGTTASHLIHEAEEVAAQALHAAQNVASSLFGAAAAYLPSAEQTKQTAAVAAVKTQDTAASAGNVAYQSLPTQDQVRGAAVGTTNVASNVASDVASRLPSIQDVRNTTADAIRSVANAIPSAEEVKETASHSVPTSIQPSRETTHAPSSGLTTTSASVSPAATLPHSNQPGSNNPFLHSSSSGATEEAGQQVGGMAAVISNAVSQAAVESPATSAGGRGLGSEEHGSARSGEGVASRPGEVNQVGGLAGVIAEDVAEAAKHSTATSVGDVPLASGQTTSSFAQSLPSQDQVRSTANQAAQSASETASQAASSVAQSLPSQEQVRGTVNNAASSVAQSLPSQEQVRGAANNAAAQVSSVLPSVQDVRNTTANAIRSVANALPSGEQVQQTAGSVAQSARDTTNSVAQQARDATQSVGQQAREVSEESQSRGGLDSVDHAASARSGEGVVSKPGEVNQVGGLAGVIAADVADAAKHSTATSVGDVPLASSQTTSSFAQSVPSQQQVRGTVNDVAQSASQTANKAASSVAQSLPSQEQVRGTVNDAAAGVSSYLPSIQDIRNTTADAIRSVANALPSGEQVQQTVDSTVQQAKEATNNVTQSAREATSTEGRGLDSAIEHSGTARSGEGVASRPGEVNQVGGLAGVIADDVAKAAQQSSATSVGAPSSTRSAALSPPALSSRESSLETPGTVKILERQVIGGPSSTAEESASSVAEPKTVSAAEDNAAFRSAVNLPHGQLTPGGITPGQELPGGWGHTNVVRPETTIYEDAEHLLKSVGQAAFSTLPHSLIERFSNHSVRDDHPISTTTNTLPHHDSTSTTSSTAPVASFIPSAQDVQNAIVNAKEVIASHLPSGQQMHDAAGNVAFNAGKAVGAVSVTGQQAAQQTRDATASATESASNLASQATNSAASATETARQTAAEGIRTTANALPSDEQIRQAIPSADQIIPSAAEATNNKSLASTELPSLQSIATTATDAVHNAAAYLGLGSPTKSTSATGEREITASTGTKGEAPASISTQQDASKGGFAATISDEVAEAARESEATSAGSVPLTSSPHVHAPITVSSSSQSQQQSAPSSTTSTQALKKNEGVEDEALVGGGGLAATIASDVAHAAEDSPATSAGSVPLSSHPKVHSPLSSQTSRGAEEYEQTGSVGSISRKTYERPSTTSHTESHSSQQVDLPSSLASAKTSESHSAVPSHSEVERISTQGEHGLVFDDKSGKYLHRHEIEQQSSSSASRGERNDEQLREQRGELVEERKESGGRGYEARDVERAPEARQQQSQQGQQYQQQERSQYENTNTHSEHLLNLGLGAPVLGGGNSGQLHTTTTQASSPPDLSTFGISSQSNTTSTSSFPATSYTQDTTTTSFAPSSTTTTSTRESHSQPQQVESALGRADTRAVDSKADHHFETIASSRASTASIAPSSVHTPVAAPKTPTSAPAVVPKESSSHHHHSSSHGHEDRARDDKVVGSVPTAPAPQNPAATPSLHTAVAPSSPASTTGHKKTFSEKMKGFLHKG